MKKLLSILVSFLMVAGMVSMSWAHGPKGSGGFRSHGTSKPYLSKPDFSRFGAGGRHGHSHFNSPRRPFRGHPSAFPRSHRLRGIGPGVIINHPGSLQNEAGLSPLEKAYNRGVGVAPSRKALERNARPPVQPYSHPSHLYHYNNSDAWFLYGNGNQLRQMGVIPRIPETSSESE